MSGLKPGDRVVVEGLQKARPGTLLKIVPVPLEEFDRPADAAGPAPAAVTSAGAT
jgi:membrane fusion protein (multidrug efflux system)